ncbi:S-adenosylmethionine synthase [Candidatus Woesearchaeota archaeon]|nr:MAG: S-adenosylmethionine synthase [Candidatus Woesearchaeota archaeon]
MKLVIESIKDSAEKQKVEIVEHKGLGHPDSICDQVCEAASMALSQYYVKHFKRVLHHNIDKALLIAGKANPAFKGGKIIQPIKIIVAGRATNKVGNKMIPVKTIVLRAVKKILTSFPRAKFTLKTEIKPGATNLTSITKKQVANDTSIGCAHYPLSKLETLVLKTGKLLRSKAFLRRFPMVGLDTKILGLRNENKIELTLAIAFIDKYIKNIDQYITAKDTIKNYLKKKTKAKVMINTLDDYKNISSCYLTVTGLSAEQGDDGNTGRGNRANGLITPNRYMSLEAIAGKNIYHPGKLYQLFAFKLAKDLVRRANVKQAEVKLLTQIGMPLEQPFVAVRVYKKTAKIESVIKQDLARLSLFQKSLVKFS